jgi:hypothetical protein
MYYELTKSQKKIARRVMDKGLENHYIEALSDADRILMKWREGKYENPREAYMKLFDKVMKNDDNIARIYNNKGGSRWVEVMAWQLAQKVISLEDLQEFDEEVRNIIIRLSGIENND